MCDEVGVTADLPLANKIPLAKKPAAKIPLAWITLPSPGYHAFIHDYIILTCVFWGRHRAPRVDWVHLPAVVFVRSFSVIVCSFGRLCRYNEKADVWSFIIIFW